MNPLIIKKTRNPLFAHTLITLSIISLSLLLTSCSQLASLFKSNNKDTEETANLIVPPTLRLPSEQKNDTAIASTQKSPASTEKKPTKEVIDHKDYFVVVGSYLNREQALDTFVRLSSIGLPHATMESRVTKSGKTLHMVRLGPFHKQSQIDAVKDQLVSDGMSQFKVVVN